MHAVGTVPCGASATEQATKLVSRALHTGHHPPTSAGPLAEGAASALGMHAALQPWPLAPQGSEVKPQQAPQRRVTAELMH